MPALTLGERLREARKRVDLTQQQLADAAGLSVSTIRKLEQGARQEARLETVRQLATVLRIPTTRLVESGPERGPLGVEAPERWEPVRRALFVAGDPVDEPPTAVGVTAALHDALALAESARYRELAQALPALIRDARALVDVDAAGRAVHTWVMQLVGHTLVQHRQFDVAEMVVESALDGAESHRQAASVAATWCWLHLRRGRLDDAQRLAVCWADEVEPRRITRAAPEELEAWGKMLTRVAASAVRDNRPGTAAAALRYARAAAEALGDRRATGRLDRPSSVFDLVNVRRNEAEYAAIADRPDTVLEIAASVPHAPTNDHRRHLLDVAHAQAALKRREEAVGTLWGIWQEAPEWLAQQVYAQDILAGIVERRRTLTPEMRQLAEAVRLPL